MHGNANERGAGQENDVVGAAGGIRTPYSMEISPDSFPANSPFCMHACARKVLNGEMPS